jgi:hypothetical protein
MAELFLARVTGIQGFEKIVVLKRILPGLPNQAEAVELLLAEARLAATLHHPNIAQVYDIGADGGEPFIAMEHVHGQDLRTLLASAANRERPVPGGVAHAIAGGMCAGLHHAHEQVDTSGAPLGIIHRDVSPSNVLVSYDGCTKVVDFGIAKAATSTVETRHGLRRGKLSYMSPEQCRGEPLDRRSDIFSIGIVLWELTTVSKLFRGSDFEVLQAIVEGPPPRPSSFRTGYPPELEAIVMKALARRPEDRYQTAQELQLELEAFARDRKVDTSSITVARYMEALFAREIARWRQAQREGKLLGEHLAGGATDPGRLEELSLSVLVDPPAGPHAPAPRPARRARPGPRFTLWSGAALAVIILGVGLPQARRAAPAADAPPRVQLTVTSTPAGASLSINDVRQAAPTPLSITVARAPARVRLERVGHLPYEQVLELASGAATHALHVALAPAPATVASGSPAAPPRRAAAARAGRTPHPDSIEGWRLR